MEVEPIGAHSQTTTYRPFIETAVTDRFINFNTLGGHSTYRVGKAVGGFSLEPAARAGFPG